MGTLCPTTLAPNKCPLDLAQFESDVSAEPDAWYSTQPFLDAYSRLVYIQVLRELTRGQQLPG